MKKKTGFESCFNLLDGFNFADAQSRENALWAALWARRAAECTTVFRPPLVVISGPQMCGKSKLARRLADQAPGDWSEFPGLSIGRIVKAGGLGVRVLLLDVPSLFPKRSCDELSRFISAREWGLQAPGAKKVALACLTVLTVCIPTLPADLEQRAVHIRLNAREPVPLRFWEPIGLSGAELLSRLKGRLLTLPVGNYSLQGLLGSMNSAFLRACERSAIGKALKQLEGRQLGSVVRLKISRKREGVVYRIERCAARKPAKKKGVRS